ncbi:MAG: 23S rRNA (uridine(2552)-2'-O)-methyltransferase [Candidatus Methanophagaceae archaeon]|nr:MAG: 23S rRNA (uridine(2552)-2'-O)-methyltransferase [Methanophagales archaeon]
MVRKGELARDRFYIKAKEEGFRSRSAYKLKEMVAKFKIMKRGDTVIDLGAAPGGWSQVASDVVGAHGVVISMDLQHIAPIEGVVTLRGDITDREATIKLLRKALMLHGCGNDSVAAAATVVLSDAAPKLSGNRVYDHYRSFELSKAALGIATALLKPGGNFVAKIFQGEYYSIFYKSVKDMFRDARAYTPKASHKRSAEVFVIGKGFKFKALKL